jgi:hypothetical protein
MLGMHDVVRMTGLSKSTIKRRVQDGSFLKRHAHECPTPPLAAGDVRAQREPRIEQGRQ